MIISQRMKTATFLSTRLVLAVWLLSSGFTLHAASTVTFDNQSGQGALVKLTGPTSTSVPVATGTKQTVNVAAGHYYIRVRYGDPDRYSYSRGDDFDVKEASTSESRIMITLHKVVRGNYGSKTISEAEFGADEPQAMPPGRTNSDQAAKSLRTGTTVPAAAEPTLQPYLWTPIIRDNEIFGTPPPWKKIEELRKMVEQVTQDHNSWDATADIAEVGIESKKLLSKYPTAQKTTGEIQFGRTLYTNVTFYHYGPIAFGAKDGSKTISFLIAPRYFFQRGFINVAEEQRTKAFDFTKVNGADDKDISIQQLVGSWVSYQSVMWRFQTNGVLRHGPDEFFVLGNRIIRDGQTQWIMVLKDNTLELWGVDYSTLSMRHKLFRKSDRVPK